MLGMNISFSFPFVFFPSGPSSFKKDICWYMSVSENGGTPKSSILIGISILNHPFGVALFLETPISIYVQTKSKGLLGFAFSFLPG